MTKENVICLIIWFMITSIAAIITITVAGAFFKIETAAGLGLAVFIFGIIGAFRES